SSTVPAINFRFVIRETAIANCSERLNSRVSYPSIPPNERDSNMSPVTESDHREGILKENRDIRIGSQVSISCAFSISRLIPGNPRNICNAINILARYTKMSEHYSYRAGRSRPISSVLRRRSWQIGFEKKFPAKEMHARNARSTSLWKVPHLALDGI